MNAGYGKEYYRAHKEKWSNGYDAHKRKDGSKSIPWKVNRVEQQKVYTGEDADIMRKGDLL